MLVFVVISDNGKVCVLCEIFLYLVNNCGNPKRAYTQGMLV